MTPIVEPARSVRNKTVRQMLLNDNTLVRLVVGSLSLKWALAFGGPSDSILRLRFTKGEGIANRSWDFYDLFAQGTG